MGSRNIAGALFAAILLTGCGTVGAVNDAVDRTLGAAPSDVGPSDVTVTVSASPDVNPDRSNRPSPILVRLYQLRSGAMLDQADYFKLTGDPQSALGDTLVAHDQALVTPGQARSLPLKLDPATRLVAVIAGYRDIDHARWRTSVDVASGKTRTIAIAVGAAAVTAKVGE